MRGCGREECRGENCRRADISEMARVRRECGRLLPLLRCRPRCPSDRLGGGAAIAKAAASRRTPKCRRADIPELEHKQRGGGAQDRQRRMGVGIKIVGAPTILFLESVRPAKRSSFVVPSLQTGQALALQVVLDRPEGRPLQGATRSCRRKNVGAPTFFGDSRRPSQIALRNLVRSHLLAVSRHFEGGFCPRNPSVVISPNRRGIPHFADSVRNDGALVGAVVGGAKLSARRQFQKLEDGLCGARMSSRARIIERGMDGGAKNVGAPTFSIWSAGFEVVG